MKSAFDFGLRIIAPAAMLSLLSFLEIATALAHDDLSPRVIGGQIVIGYHNDGFSDISPSDGLDDTDGRPQNGVPVAPVFGFDLSLNYDLSLGNADDHYYRSQDPGINSLASPPGASPLPGSTTLSSNFIPFTMTGNSTPANLFYWDGVTTDGGGNPSFAPATSTIFTLLGLNSQSVDGNNTAVNGLIWGNTSPSGSMHFHADTRIDDTINPGVSPSPPAGVYVVGLEFTMPGLLKSDPVWFAYAAGINELVHDEAIDWLSNNLPQPVPEPTGLILACIAGMAGLIARLRK